MNTDYRGRKERIDVAGRLHVDGHSYSDIAEKLGVSERTARRDVKASGVEVRRNAPAPYSHEMRQEMCDLYKQGKSITQTAEELDVSRTAVQHALEVFGVQARSRSKANALRWQDEEFRRNQIE